MNHFPRRSFGLVPVAQVGEQFADFAPYVASINDAGAVAFHAALRRGGSGVFVSDGRTVRRIADTSGPFAEIHSHPDINAAGVCCFYARLKSGEDGVFLVDGEQVSAIAKPSGPLGPTMNDAGNMAFRAEHSNSIAGIYTGCVRSVTTIADTSQGFAMFHGLPVINSIGQVAFRADLADGRQCIQVSDGVQRKPVVQTGEGFDDLGFFPVVNDAGVVGFRGTRRDGESGLFLGESGKIECILAGGLFESFRGLLLNNCGEVVFFATPRGGQLGVFGGPDPARDRVVALGTPLFGSSVTDMALNPVSMNERGQLAIRVKLADERQFILRADPS